MRSTAILGILAAVTLAASAVAARAAEAGAPPAASAWPGDPPPPVVDRASDPATEMLVAYARGCLLATDGKMAAAVEAFRKAAALAPEAAVIQHRLGLALYAGGNPKAAAEALDRALALDPTDAATLYHRARCAQTLDDAEGAVKFLRSLRSTAAANSPYYLLGSWHLARMAEKAGNVDEAVVCYESLLEGMAEAKAFLPRYPELYQLYRSHPMILRILGELYLKNGRTDKAIEVLRAALSERPGQPELLDLLCRALVARKDFASVRVLAHRIIEAHPEGGAGYQRLADAYRAEGNLAGLIADLQAIRREHPGYVMATFQLAGVYESLGRENDAVAEYRTLVALGDKAPGTVVAATVKLAEVHMKKKQAVEAIADLAAGLDVLKSDAPNASADNQAAETALLVRAGRLLGDIADPEAVYAEGRRLVTGDAKTYGSLLLMGMLAENLKWPNDAAAFYAEAQRLRPRSVVAYSREADLLIGAGRLEEALHTLQAARDAGLSVPLFERQQGQILERLDRPEEAVTAYRRAVEGNPEDRAARILLAGALARGDKLGEAETVLREGLERLGDDADMLCQLAGVYLVQDDVAAAERAVDRARVLDARGVEPRGLMAEIRLRQKRYEEAEKLARDLANEAPTATGVRVILACAMAGRKDFKDAIAEMEALLATDPENLQWRYLLAGFHTEGGDVAGAEEEYLRILSKEPAHVASNNDLGYLWADRGVHLDRAEKMIRLALKAEPKSPAYLDSLGWVLYKRGQMEEAVKALEAAVAEAPEIDAVMWDHLGDAYWRQSRPADAMRAWQKALGIVKTQGDAAEAGELDRLKEKLESSRVGKTPAAVAPLGSAEAAGAEAPPGTEQGP